MYMREASDMRTEKILLPESYGGTAFSKGGEALRGIPSSAPPEKSAENQTATDMAVGQTPGTGTGEYRAPITGAGEPHLSVQGAREPAAGGREAHISAAGAPEPAAASAEEYRSRPAGGEIKASALASGLSGILGGLLQNQEQPSGQEPRTLGDAPREQGNRRSPSAGEETDRNADDATPTGGSPSSHRRGIPFARLLSGLPLDSLLGGVKGFFPSLTGMGMHMPHFGTEECILLGLAALLFFSPEGDRETALLLCLLVFIG